MIPKFRAWSEDTCEMVQVARLDFKEETIYYENGNKSLNREQELGFWWKPYVLMQSTGLFDKNGKEFFDGDIVEWEHKDTGQIVRGIVKYDTELGFWGMTDVRFDDLRAIGYLANQRVTVLGNIYQNKELMEVE